MPSSGEGENSGLAQLVAAAFFIPVWSSPQSISGLSPVRTLLVGFRAHLDNRG